MSTFTCVVPFLIIRISTSNPYRIPYETESFYFKSDWHEANMFYSVCKRLTLDKQFKTNFVATKLFAFNYT